MNAAQAKQRSRGELSTDKIGGIEIFSAAEGTNTWQLSTLT
jgi:hypothetical protein